MSEHVVATEYRPQGVAIEHAPEYSGGHAEHGAHGHDEHHGPLHHHFEDMGQQREATSLGMWGFLTTEVMMFGVLFFTYALYRWKFANAAHVAGQSDPFYAGSHMLNHTLGMANTLVLLVSSLTMAMAVHYAQEKNRKKLLMFMGATWVLGLVFLIVKGFEWTADYHEGLVPFLNMWNPFETLAHKGFEIGDVNVNHLRMYYVIYFCMTGLHGIHMVIGLAVVGWMMRLAAKGWFTNGNDQPIEILGLYWHFVDIVWIFLFPMLYLIAGHPPHPVGH